MLVTIDAYVDPRNKVVDVERYFLDDQVLWSLKSCTYELLYISLRNRETVACGTFTNNWWRVYVFTVCDIRIRIFRKIWIIINVGNIDTLQKNVNKVSV